MLIKRNIIVLLFIIISAVWGCALREHHVTKPPLNAVSIKWDPDTLTMIQPNGFYSRIIRLRNGEMLCSFEYDMKIWLRRSIDEGRTWSEKILIKEWDKGVLTNAELLQLRSGTLLCFYNERPDNRNAEEKAPFAICMTRSLDNGNTWGDTERLYAADVIFHNGCWEPTGIQLPSGEVQVYFANENPYRQSDEQEITLMRSDDGGFSWGEPERICYRAGFRDGMPVPLMLNNGKYLVVSIEDNGINGNLEPVTVRTSINDNWKSGYVDGDSKYRKRSLNPPQIYGCYAGAPFLRQMPAGHTILSYQIDEAGDLSKAKMEVRIGDENAENFSGPTRPFSGLTDAGQHWNSLFIKNPETITAVAGTAINGAGGIWSIDGHIPAIPYEEYPPSEPNKPK